MKAPEAAGTGAPSRRRARLWPLIVGFGILLALALLGPIMTIGDTQLTGEGNPFREVIYLVAMSLIVFAVRPIHHPGRLLVVPVALVVALAWCWLSLIWAIDPDIALRRLILTTLVIWSIFVAVTQLNYEMTLRMVRIALVLALIANFGAVLLVPTIGIHQALDSLDPGLIGSWRGIMMQKNFAGLTCALTIIVFLIDARRVPIAIRGVVLTFAIFFLYETQSRTSWASCVAALAIGLVFQRYNARYRAVLLPLATAVLVAAGAALTAYDPIDDRLSTNHALTGRPEIWDMLLRFSADHRLLGSGYGSFWNIGDDSPVYHYTSGWVTTLAAGHCGFLDMLVSIGVPGLILVVFAVFLWPVGRLLRSPEAAGSRGAMVMALIVFCVAHNMTESSVFDRESIGQVFLMIVIALLLTITPSASNRRPAVRDVPVRRRPNAPRDYGAGLPERAPPPVTAPGNGTFPVGARRQA